MKVNAITIFEPKTDTIARSFATSRQMSLGEARRLIRKQEEALAEWGYEEHPFRPATYVAEGELDVERRGALLFYCG